MYISEEEYLALKSQINELQQKVGALNKVRDFASVVKIKPYSHITNEHDATPIFSPSCRNSEAWNVFTCLGRYIHQKPRYFYMGTTHPNNLKPYIRSNGTGHARKIADLTPEQMELSVQMLSELIEVYNRYFKKANPYIYYAENEYGHYEKVEVVYPE